jgi:MAF protein
MTPTNRLVLASASPRRRQILGVLGIPFEAIDVGVDESQLPGEAPVALAQRLAITKAQIGAARYPGAFVLGADTVVELHGQSLGKPASAAEAVEMLVRLRGRGHHVVTAVALATQTERFGVSVSSRLATTEVWMRDYSDQEIRDYVASGDPFDKAGSYAIQHARFRPVERISGCFLNVVGLPLPEVGELLREAGLAWEIAAAALETVCAGCTDTSRLAIR